MCPGTYARIPILAASGSVTPRPLGAGCAPGPTNVSRTSRAADSETRRSVAASAGNCATMDPIAFPALRSWTRPVTAWSRRCP